MAKYNDKIKSLNDQSEMFYDSEEAKKLSPYSAPLIIAITYGIFGAIWILLSDRILDFLTDNPVVYKQLQTYKGWLYVFVTMGLAYILTQKTMRLMQRANNKTIKAYMQLRKAHEELVSMERELEYQKHFTKNIINDAHVIIGVWDETGKIISVNPFGQKTFGYREDELINKRWLDLLISKENQTIMNDVFEEIKKNKELKNHESQFMSKDGSPIDILWNSSMLNYSGSNNKIVSIGVDITERKKYEENVSRIAFYDTLTGLPNRIMFENEIKNFLHQKIEKNKVAIIYIDIDNFKYINDTLGHQAGDEFLKYIGDTLNTEIKIPNLVARLGGDEFAILFTELQSNEILIETIEEIKKKIGRTWSIKNHQFFVSMSIGIAKFPDHGHNITELLKNADIAMYAAKQEGKDKILFYKKDIQTNNLNHVQMANKLQSAIENEEFMLFYQPQFKLNTGEIVGLEALIRWNHHEEGFISPVEFIPVAEDTGQIYSIERWIVKTALAQKKQWEKEGLGHVELSINLSGKTLTSDVNFQELEILLSTFDVDYSKITIEITETAIISNVDLVIRRLNRLKAKGLKIALDDFGTGYSSLTYLKKFPINIIKLDRSFIQLIPKNSIDTVIIKHILSLAHDLRYEVIAEGIETREQLEYLKKCFCENGQGYLLSKPLSQEKVNELMNSFRLKKLKDG
ncbi:EAL domain-containing protein [Clostridium formicaceticum]|uniref:Cyclic di-GMP phosphodiesterase Gmr n=1 Tax=Clostridium formicaceticum TaxID=1497 RepID=A0AAC9RR46_9CLOT|nr:EAL domain-containing protein [Clostridium formicaceticum]AOY75357.1 hypothetical protein BJL90_05260 [Clostridium formicaceticum]ARE89812.1 Cyclic di-GMP phosphodiesterase Gmr [Clostridium formicaceticum]